MPQQHPLRPATLHWLPQKPTDGRYPCHLRAGHHDYAKHGTTLRTRLIFYGDATDPTEDLAAIDIIHAHAHAAGYWIAIERFPDGTINDYQQEEQDAIEDAWADNAEEALIDGFSFSFRDPGGPSALRAATKGRCPNRSCGKRIGWRDEHCHHCGTKLNPRRHPCPTCGAKNVLTTADVQLHYQCNHCAARAEGTYVGADY